MNYLCLSLISAIIVQIHSDSNTLLIKKNEVPDREPINKNLRPTFHEFLQHTNAYVDKTSLIKFIFSDNTYARRITYTAPRGWGKTLNLQLLKFFTSLELGSSGEVLPQEDTKAYQFFKYGKLLQDDGTVDDFKTPPFISTCNDIIENYLARYPVILLDFSNLEAVYDFDKFKKQLREIIGNEFMKYSRVVSNLCVNRINAYNRMVEETTCTESNYTDFLNLCYKHENDEGKLENSVHLLISLLYTIYENKVILMMDEYDSFVSSVYVRDEEFEFYDNDRKNIDIEYFFIRFVRHSVKSDKLMHKAILCGLFPFNLRIGDFCENAFHNEIYCTHIDNEWYPYYGFSTEEVNAIFDYANISGSLADEARSLYGGYHVHNNTELVTHVPLSIVNFVHYRKLDYYWSKEKVPKFTKSMLRNRRQTLVLSALMFDSCFDFSDRTRFPESEPTLYESKPYVDIADFGEIITNTVNFYFPWYLNAIGYMTTVDYMNRTHCSQIPNQEVRFIIGKGFLDAEMKYGCEKNAAETLIQLLGNWSADVGDLVKEFKNILIKDNVNTRFGLKHELRFRIRFYDVVKKARELCNDTEVFKPEIITIPSINHTPMNQTLNEEASNTSLESFETLFRTTTIAPNPNFDYELRLSGSNIVVSKNGSAIMVEMKFDRRDNILKEFVVEELWPKAGRYFANHPNTKLLRVILIRGHRCNETLMYVNYTFNSAKQIPKSEPPKAPKKGKGIPKFDSPKAVKQSGKQITKIKLSFVTV